MMRTVTSALGLVALLVAIVVGMFAAYGPLGKTPIQPLPGPERLIGPHVTKDDAVPVEQGDPKVAAIGETVTAGDVAWTVTDARQADEISKHVFPPETVPGNYVSLTFTVENVSEEPVTLTQSALTLLTDKGQKLPPEADDNSPFVVPEKNLLFSEAGLLEPGETKEGRVNFELPSGSASASMVQLGDTDPTAEEERYVDLGF